MQSNQNNQQAHPVIYEWYTSKIVNIAICIIELVIVAVLLIGYLAFTGLIYLAFIAFNLYFHLTNDDQKVKMLRSICCLYFFPFLIVFAVITNILIFFLNEWGAQILADGYAFAWLMMVQFVLLLSEAFLFIMCIQIERKMYAIFFEDQRVNAPQPSQNRNIQVQRQQLSQNQQQVPLLVGVPVSKEVQRQYDNENNSNTQSNKEQYQVLY
eukprot:403372325